MNTFLPVGFCCAALLIVPSFAYSEARFIDGSIDADNLRNLRNWPHIEISGKITASDAKQMPVLIQLATQKSNILSPDGKRVPAVYLNSQGGEVIASMQIGRLLRKVLAQVFIFGSDECSSACVFILAGGIERSVSSDARIGLHRPVFEPTMFAGLSRNQAQALYGKLIAVSRAYLQEMGMSESLWEKMLNVPSQKVLYLSYNEVEAFGLEGGTPAYQEWRRAKNMEGVGKEQWEKIEKYVECLNSGVGQAVCTQRWGVR